MSEDGVSDSEFSKKSYRCGRRKFLGGMLALPAAGYGAVSGAVTQPTGAYTHYPRKRIRALLVSATTIAGKQSLEHAWEALDTLYSGKRNILLINFASLPADRDAYAERMQRDFARISDRFKVSSLHAFPVDRAGEAVGNAEAVFVSGGNTFLLLRELYDRKAVDLLRDRVLGGLPYAGSSAGSNIAGIDIGTTNDFPITDVPTRRSLGIMAAVYNPHHPDRGEEAAFGSRQWKIRQYAAYNPSKAVIGVNNNGMIEVTGDSLTLRGRGGEATIQLHRQSASLNTADEADISNAIERMRTRS